VIPYGKQYIDETDIEAVVEVLKSDWLTTGPKVQQFEEALACYTEAQYAVAVSNGTAALHSMIACLDIGSGDEVIVPTMTFVATANCVLYQGAAPVLVDVNPDSMLLDIECVDRAITGRTKAVIAVDYAGHPADYSSLRALVGDRNIKVLADSCHALGAKYNGKPVSAITDATVYSFHPVKHVTTGEGGAVTTFNGEYAERIRVFRNHGMEDDFRDRERNNQWEYAINSLGFNYRITDIQCALGISQLKKNDEWLSKRREIAIRYDRALESIDGVKPLFKSPTVDHAYHLYVIKLDESIERRKAFVWLRENKVGVNVHYKPIHLHSYHQKRLNLTRGMYPQSEKIYDRILSIPLYPTLKDTDQSHVIEMLSRLRKECSK
jgi:perosamine synthetase